MRGGQFLGHNHVCERFELGLAVLHQAIKALSKPQV